MGVAALVDQHAINRGAQIGAVVQVEAAQVKLVRLALATVLAHHQARHRLQHFTRAVHGTRFKLLLGDDARVGSLGLAQDTVARTLHDHGWQDRGDGLRQCLARRPTATHQRHHSTVLP